jgi:hypothetical protein
MFLFNGNGITIVMKLSLPIPLSFTWEKPTQANTTLEQSGTHIFVISTWPHWTTIHSFFTSWSQKPGSQTSSSFSCSHANYPKTLHIFICPSSPTILSSFKLLQFNAKATTIISLFVSPSHDNNNNISTIIFIYHSKLGVTCNNLCSKSSILTSAI